MSFSRGGVVTGRNEYQLRLPNSVNITPHLAFSSSMQMYFSKSSFEIIEKATLNRSVHY
jgi:hypothetical protein